MLQLDLVMRSLRVCYTRMLRLWFPTAFGDVPEAHSLTPFIRHGSPGFVRLSFQTVPPGGQGRPPLLCDCCVPGSQKHVATAGVVQKRERVSWFARATKLPTHNIRGRPGPPGGTVWKDSFTNPGDPCLIKGVRLWASGTSPHAVGNHNRNIRVNCA